MIRPKVFTKVNPMIEKEKEFNVASKGIAIKTAKSCINNIPKTILPCNVSICSVSDSNLTTIIVELNARTKPIIIASNWDNP